MRIVVRVAGSLLESPATARNLARQISAVANLGHDTVVVHGGNHLVTEELKRLGIPGRYEGGLLVVDRVARDVAVQVLAGWLSKRLSAAICKAGSPAVKISPASVKSFRGEPLVRENVSGKLGYEGYLAGVNKPFFESLWFRGAVPVSPPLAPSVSGETYYINPDHMAAACAEYLGAEKLLFLSSHDYLPLSYREFLPLTRVRIATLFNHSAAEVRTVLKLEAIKRALEAGIRSVLLVNPAHDKAMIHAVLAEPADVTNELAFPFRLDWRSAQVDA
jgi:acetylglutamate kinase